MPQTYAINFKYLSTNSNNLKVCMKLTLYNH